MPFKLGIPEMLGSATLARRRVGLTAVRLFGLSVARSLGGVF